MNNQINKTKMPCQEPDIRNKNFIEVASGYTEEMARNEAERCLNCKNRPCTTGCPVNVKIPDFISCIKNGEYEKAYEIITQDNSLPAICGRVCPQENQCEGKCIRGIKGEPVGIGRLERFVADYHNKNFNESNKKLINKNGINVGIIGSGPAGLTCAGVLAKKGYNVTIFEALHLSGGVLAYGIPEFRLPKEIVRKEVEILQSNGVNIITDFVVGKTMTIDELKEEYNLHAVFIGTGAGLPQFTKIKGENLPGVFASNEFLTRINLMKAYKENSATFIYRPKKTVVVGGGNVAMDSARVAKRLGSEVTICYRRTEKELPARKEEIENAKEEGIVFKMLTNPIEIIPDENGWVKEVKCEVMKLGEPDASGRARPIPTGETITIEADCFIVAIGTTPNPLIKNTTPNLSINPKGGIIVDENGLTSIEGVYAGGDSVSGAATVISAMGMGKRAAEAIDIYLQGKNNG
ncbi:MAG: NADPH-dependent glutamate synthase [Clostridia bacterium]|nr:NADPH-dependent glutamate synthase [Clostridia bacterium]